MSNEHHSWQVGSSLPLIRPHSQAKHRLLRTYLERYIAVLTANPRRSSLRLTLVDGFAGGGQYSTGIGGDIQPGSPLIALEAMEVAQVLAQGARSKPFHLDVKYIFVEKDAGAAIHLRRVISDSKYRHMLDGDIKIIHGEFVEHSPEIEEYIKNRKGRSIFVLDQFGYTDVPLPLVSRILTTLRKSEVILTFAVDSLIDYLSDDEQTQKRLERVGIALPTSTLADLKAEHSWRRTIQFALHEEIPPKTNAGFYTPFFIRSTDAHRDLWLIHLSGHYRARDVMVGLHWQESTSFSHYGRAGLQMLGYDPERDASWNTQQLLPGFYFDEAARVASQSELLNQLPEQIYRFKQGIVFNDLFSELTNHCPVTAEIMSEVTETLAKEGVISVRSKSGRERRGGVTVGTDIVIPNSQKVMFY